MPFLFERGSTSLLFPFCFPFPLEYSLLLIHDGLTACFAFSVDRQSGHSSTLVQEMPTSLTSPSLKTGMTHVFLLSRRQAALHRRQRRKLKNPPKSGLDILTIVPNSI